MSMFSNFAWNATQTLYRDMLKRQVVGGLKDGDYRKVVRGAMGAGIMGAAAIASQSAADAAKNLIPRLVAMAAGEEPPEEKERWWRDALQFSRISDIIFASNFIYGATGLLDSELGYGDVESDVPLQRVVNDFLTGFIRFGQETYNRFYDPQNFRSKKFVDGLLKILGSIATYKGISGTAEIVGLTRRIISQRRRDIQTAEAKADAILTRQQKRATNNRNAPSFKAPVFTPP